jgi:ankyrin repeat protein
MVKKGKLKKTLLLVLILLFSAGIFFHRMTRNQAERNRLFLDAVDAGYLAAVRDLLADEPALISIQDHRTKASHGPPLRLAILRCHADIVEFLLSNGANPNERYITGVGPLHEAAKKGHPDSVKVLVKYGADVNGIKGGFTHPPLCFATSREVTEALIAAGADMSIRDKSLSGATPLHTIAGSGLIEAAEVLLTHGADIDAKDSLGRTPLHRAANSGRKKMAGLLIANGADINARDTRGLTPLNIAIDSDWAPKVKRKEVAELLVANDAEYTIRDVAWIGDSRRIDALLKNNPAPANDASGMYKEAVIFAAIREGYGSVVQLLLDRGARLDVQDRYDCPPLHVAAHAGHNAIVIVLLKAGADANEKGAYGELPLHWAATKGHLEVTKALVEAGSQVNTKTTKQRIDMDTMMKKTADVVKFQLKTLELLEKGRQATLKGRSYQMALPSRLAFAAEDTPLHSAAQWGHEEIVKLLLANGAEAEAKNHFGQQPLHYACVFRHKEVVNVLLDTGADPNAKDDDENTPLGLASFPKGNPAKDIAKILRAKGDRK